MISSPRDTARGAPVALSLVIPTYNEAQNIPVLLEQLSRALAGQTCEIIVVDDDSPDQTWRAAERFAEKDPSVKVVRRTDERGLSSAVVRGFELARGETLGAMDADLSHDPAILPKMLAAVREGAELAVGSRRVPGGGAENWPWYRRSFSEAATRAARFLLGVPINDPMSGYFVIRRELFERALPALQPRGYKILLELAVKANARRIVEVPFIFKDRQQGYSKLSAGVVSNYLWQVLSLAAFRWKRRG